MRDLTCFIIIPSNREEHTPTQLIRDERRGLVERPSSCREVDGACIPVNFDTVCTNIIEAALLEAANQCRVRIKSERGVDIHEPGNILDQVLPRICNADITITDLTTHNPNVFLEYGIRSSVKEKLNIIIAHETVKLPFNIESQRCIYYSLEIGKADLAKQAIVKFIKDYVEANNPDLGVESNERIKRNVDLYSGRKREQDIIKAFEPAPQLIADLASFLLKNGSDPILKQKTINFLYSFGAMLEKDDRGQARAISHYLMMCEIEGLSTDRRQEIFLKLSELYDENTETKDKAAEFLEKAKNLEGQ